MRRVSTYERTSAASEPRAWAKSTRRERESTSERRADAEALRDRSGHGQTQQRQPGDTGKHEEGDEKWERHEDEDPHRVGPGKHARLPASSR